MEAFTPAEECGCTDEIDCDYHRGFADGWDLCAHVMRDQTFEPLSYPELPKRLALVSD